MTDVIVLNVKKIAKQKGIKLSEIEQAIGVSSGYLSRCTKGKCSLPVSRIQNIAEVLQVQCADLFAEPCTTWKKKDIGRAKSYLWVCPKCGQTCYYIGKQCGYRYCPNCGKEIQ